MEVINGKKLYEYDDYRELAKDLQIKYGYAKDDYYRIGKNTKLVRGNVSRGSEGLQCHHICEDIVPGLSSKEQAEKYWSEHPEYQRKENLCYCNLLEHAWLHILISECSGDYSDEEENVELGVGGVKWMMIALNSILCNEDVSWYSSKRISDGRGCNYNANKIITDNKDTYLKIVNRFCTSSFIRNKTGKTPSELADMICVSCKADGTIKEGEKAKGSLKQLYKEIHKEASRTFLKKHNVGVFCDLENYLRIYRTALVCICTGGGKTTTASEYVRVHNLRPLVLGSNDTIGDQWKKFSTYTYMNYQTFMNIYKEINYSKYDILICDECHHTDAPRWGEGLKWVLDKTNLKIIGLTATPTSKQFSDTDKYFGGRICYGLEIAEGLDKGIIWPFSYIQSIYKLSDIKGEFDKYGSTGTLLYNRLNLYLNENPIKTILRKHMPEGQRKIIVFCSSVKDVDYAKKIMSEYNPDLEVRCINSNMSKEEVVRNKAWFNDEKIKSVCLLTVGMVNEGAHYDGVNTLIMFRRTQSTTLYLQQLGRLISLKSSGRPDPNGIVFDFTNNAQSLIHNSKLLISKENCTERMDDEKQQMIENVQRAIREHVDGKEKIYADYTQNCAECLSALMTASETNRRTNYILKTFADEYTEDLSELIDLELYKNYKTTSNSNGKNEKATGTTKIGKHASNSKLKDTFSKNIKATTQEYKVSDAEKIANALAVLLKRSYRYGFINFDDNHNFTLNIKNEKEFSKCIKWLGFKNDKVVKNVVIKLGKFAFIIASTLD